MDLNFFLSCLLKALGSLAATVVTTLASILFVKLKTKIKESRITAFIKETVQAAEQLYPNEGKKMGPEKYEYVVTTVLAKFPTLTDNEYLKNLIEGAVYALSAQTKQIANEIKNKQEGNTSKNNTVISSF